MVDAKSAHVSRHDRIAERELGLIPADATVSATNSLGAHVSARRRIFSFPYVRGAQWVVLSYSLALVALYVAVDASKRSLARRCAQKANSDQGTLSHPGSHPLLEGLEST